MTFDPDIQVRHGAFLPHWTKEGAVYHVCIRLADSLPQSKLKEWKEERQEIVRYAERQKRLLTKSEQQRLDFLLSGKVEEWLDAGRGSCFLQQERIAELVANTLKFFDGERYKLFAWCIMPNHVHVTVQPITHTLPEILNSWKKFTAREANKILEREGQPFWQREYFDHLIRNQEYRERTVEYVWRNSDKAGLNDPR